LSCNGWLAAVRRPCDPGIAVEESLNVVGAAFAAVLGAAQIFRDALGKPDLYPPGFSFDAFSAVPCSASRSYTDTGLPEDRDVGSLLMVGAGSVGSAAAYFLDLFGVTGRLRLIDGDVVKVENFARSPVFGKRNYGHPKALAVANSIEGGGLQVDATNQWWNNFCATAALEKYDIWIPLANDHDVRWHMQNSVPPIMIHASTGSNWNANFGRHIPGRDDCLADRFADLAPKPVFRCSTGNISSDGEKRVDASLPFLSFFAGALIAADLLKTRLDGYPHTANFANYSFRGPRFTPQMLGAGPRVHCICTTQGDAFWALRGSGRYAYLSPVAWS